MIKSLQGPASLRDINASLLKDRFSGYVRASCFNDQGRMIECVSVYSAGGLIMSFFSDEDRDSSDRDQQLMAVIANGDGSTIEVCSLNESQIRLMTDFGKDFIIKPWQSPASTAPAEKNIPAKEPYRTAPVKQTYDPSTRQQSLPEIRGRFIKMDKITSIKSYIESGQWNTAHIILLPAGDENEYHIIISNGKAAAAYSHTVCGNAMMDMIDDLSGQVEIYHLDEPVIQSILKRYPAILIGTVTAHMESGPGDQAGRGIGISAASLLEKTGIQKQASTMASHNGTVTEQRHYDIDDDVAFVKKIESDFADGVDELLKRLELSHLKAMNVKKRQ